jgi:hypothetical protein
VTEPPPRDPPLLPPNNANNSPTSESASATPTESRYAAFAAPPPLRLPSIDDPHESARKAIAYRLIWLMIGIICGSGAMLFIILFCRIDGGVNPVLQWMGLALSPVAALAGSAVTFYMQRPRPGSD